MDHHTNDPDVIVLSSDDEDEVKNAPARSRSSSKHGGSSGKRPRLVPRQMLNVAPNASGSNDRLLANYENKLTHLITSERQALADLELQKQKNDELVAENKKLKEELAASNAAKEASDKELAIHLSMRGKTLLESLEKNNYLQDKVDEAERAKIRAELHTTEVEKEFQKYKDWAKKKFRSLETQGASKTPGAPKTPGFKTPGPYNNH